MKTDKKDISSVWSGWLTPTMSIVNKYLKNHMQNKQQLVNNCLK